MNKIFAAFGRLSRDAALNVTFVGMTIVLSLLAWLGIAFLQQSLNELERDITKREALLEHADGFRTSSLSLKEDLRAVEAKLQALQAKLPDTPEESQLLHELSERALATGVSLSDF